MSIFSSLGRIVLSFLYDLYEIGGFVLSSVNTLLFRFTAGRRAISSIIYKQIYFTGIEAFPIISWIAIILGIIIVTQAMSILPMLGGEGLIGEILVWIVIRELGPVFAAIIVIARSGTAIASELGSMQVGNEVSVLEAMGFVDIIASLLKSVVFGLIIGAVSAMHGMRVSRSITEIPQQTTKAVISSLFLVFVVDGIITAMFFM